MFHDFGYWHKYLILNDYILDVSIKKYTIKRVFHKMQFLTATQGLRWFNEIRKFYMPSFKLLNTFFAKVEV